MKNNKEIKVNGRRLNGEGSISRVKGRNLFLGQISVEGRKFKRYGKTRGEVRNKLREAKQLAQAGVDPNSKETVKQYLMQWHDKDETLRPKTVHSRLVNIKRMLPHIGTVQLKDLRASQIEIMYKELATGLTPYSVRQVNAVLRKALKDAVREGKILSNPIDHLLKQPTAKHKEKEYLSEMEVDLLLKTDDDWTPLFAVLIYAGLRISEALGLEWDNVDLETANLKVTRGLHRVAGLGLKYEDPKTDSSRRTVPLYPEVVVLLQKHKDRQRFESKKLGLKWNSDGLVFPNSLGNPMEESTANRALQRATCKIGVEKHITPHDLRRTCGSIMYQRGVNIKNISKILGHADMQTTLKWYVLTDDTNLRDAINVLGEAISGGE